jgi:hypothetical protein
LYDTVHTMDELSFIMIYCLKKQRKQVAVASGYAFSLKHNEKIASDCLNVQESAATDSLSSTSFGAGL